MPILILSSENKELERELAEIIAQKLGYTTLDEQFFNIIADTHLIDRKKIRQAMNTTPSIVKRMPVKFWYYCLSCVELEVLEHLVEDDCVCWGLWAHFYVMDISHVLKVRLIGDAASTQLPIVPVRTKKQIAQAERNREKWSLAAFNRKEADPGFYDMVIDLDQNPVSQVADTLIKAMGDPKYRAMTYSKNNLMDFVLAARVKNALLKSLTDIQVHAQDGTVVVTTRSMKRGKLKKIETIKEIAGQVNGVGYLEVHWYKDIITLPGSQGLPLNGPYAKEMR